jgi:hypothetical protein
VDSVEPTTNPLPTCKPLDAVKDLLNAPSLHFALDESAQGNPAHGRVEACWSYSVDCVAEIRHHPLIAATHLAYSEHRPLVLSPDVIWVTIAQGLAQHIRLDAEKYRYLLVRHQGRRELRIERTDIHRRSPENPWANVVEDFVAALRGEVGELADRFVCDFSTTGSVERTVSGVVLLDMFEPYFSYHMVAGCGIPSVTLEGTASDWRHLREKIELLAPFDFDWWLEELRPICDQFVAAADGKADRRHWLRIYKFRSAYGVDRFNGWLGKLFPYTKNYETGNYSQRNPLFDPKVAAEIDRLDREEKNDRFMRSAFHAPGISHEELPRGTSVVPFTVDFGSRGHKTAMELIAGPLAVTQDSATLALRPTLGWAVRESPPIEQAILQLEAHTTEPTSQPEFDELLSHLRVSYIPTDVLRFYRDIRRTTIHATEPSATYNILPLDSWRETDLLGETPAAGEASECYCFATTGDGTELLIQLRDVKREELGSIFVGRRNGEAIPETGQKIAKSFTDFLLRALASGERPYYRHINLKQT